MEKHDNVSRRSFLSFVAAAPLLSALAGKKLAGKKHIPIGLELYSVREDLKKDLLEQCAA